MLLILNYFIVESDSNDIDNIEGGRNRKRIRNQGNLVIPIEGAYDPQQFTNLQVGPEMAELFQHILRYDLSFKLLTSLFNEFLLTIKL